jgi:pseudouridine-5'-phosphate glycosidase
MKSFPEYFKVSVEVQGALSEKRPIVALETTVLTHGLPYPSNLDLAHDMEHAVRRAGALPATIGVLDGKVWVGLDQDQIERLATPGDKVKISIRDFGSAIAHRYSGGITVAGTLFAAHQAGIQVFATGGIGGVHRKVDPGGTAFDISADLPALAHYPVAVVCAGAKAILDLPATLEYLETMAVPVIGYGTSEFPAFYSRSSGLKLHHRVDTPGEAAALVQAQWSLGLPSAVLICVPVPTNVALDGEAIDHVIQQALQEAFRKGITGPAVTPFLLERVTALSGGDSLQANLGLLLNNAQVAAQIACAC